MLYGKREIDKLIERIDAYANSMEEKKEEEKLRKLYDYFNKNKDDLIPYQERGIDIPAAPDGLEYRGMGACEHNIYLVAAKRMKKKGASWSRTGANNLGKILALKVSDKLRNTLEEITKVTLADVTEKKIITILSSKQSPKCDGKGYEGRIVNRPYENSARTDGRKIINKTFDLKPISELKYI